MQRIISLISIAELADQLRLSRRWLRREVASGRIPYLQAGKRRMFNAEAVRQVLSDRAACGKAPR